MTPAQEPQSVADLVAALRIEAKYLPKTDTGYVCVEKAAALLEALSKVPLVQYGSYQQCAVCHQPKNGGHAKDCPVANLHKTLADLGMKL